MTYDLIEMLQEHNYSTSEIVELLMDIDKTVVEDYAVSKWVCPRCYSDLKVHTYKEPREGWGRVVEENMSEIYCRNCGYNL